MMKNILPTSLILALSISTSTAAGESWMTDFEAAKAKAAKENKDLLLDFTGSDWCPPCKRLTANVLGKEEFQKKASEKFVLVELDFPNDKSKLSEATQKQNEELQKKYNIQGYPTILLLDVQGRPYAQTGFREGGPTEYLSHLDDLHAGHARRDKALDAASKLQGIPKAEALVKAVKELPKNQLGHYQDILDEIKQLDPEDKTGFVKQQATEAAYEQLMQNLRGKSPEQMLTAIDELIKTHQPEGETLSSLNGLKLRIQISELTGQQKIDEALALVDKHITDNKLEGEAKQEALGAKMEPLLRSGKFDMAEKVLADIIAAAPESEAAKFAENFKPRLQQMKEQANATKEGE